MSIQYIFFFSVFVFVFFILIFHFTFTNTFFLATTKTQVVFVTILYFIYCSRFITMNWLSIYMSTITVNIISCCSWFSFFWHINLSVLLLCRVVGQKTAKRFIIFLNMCNTINHFNAANSTHSYISDSFLHRNFCM